MGLAIGVGVLAHLGAHDAEGTTWLTQQIRIVNEFLTSHGLPPHVEPKVPVPDRSRANCHGFPYSFLHHLRRAAAYRYLDNDYRLQPVDKLTRQDDANIEDAGANFDFHLLVHSDSEGFYVPIDFRDVLFDTDNRGLAGGMLGSTIRLMQELRAVAPALGIRLEADGGLSDDEAVRLDAVTNEDPAFKELLVWLALFEAARLSIEYKTMIVFS